MTSIYQVISDRFEKIVAGRISVVLSLRPL